MLTHDLVRAQVRKGVLHPRWIDAAKPELLGDAEALIGHFSDNVGRSAGELEEVIADFAALRTDVILVRGLAKLCWDRTETAVTELRTSSGEAVSPGAIRAAVFRAAGARWPVSPSIRAAGFTPRDEVIAAAAAELDLEPVAVEAGLFADLKRAQRIESFDAPKPAALLERYNLSLAQACLLRARAVRVDVGGLTPKRARALFRELKFRRLLFTAEPTAGGYRLTLDGPLSLFKQTNRYGGQLAFVLPAFVRCRRWSLEADLRWSRGGGRPREITLKLDQDAPLVATGRDKGVWTSAEEKHFIAGFEKLDTPWRLKPAARVIDLDGRDTLVPDYVLIHPDGREVLLDLIFTWRKKQFAKHLELIARAGPRNLVIALAARGDLGSSGAKADHELPGELAIHRFKGVIPPKRILELAERVALTHRPRAAT